MVQQNPDAGQSKSPNLVVLLISYCGRGVILLIPDSPEPPRLTHGAWPNGIGHGPGRHFCPEQDTGGPARSEYGIMGRLSWRARECVQQYYCPNFGYRYVLVETYKLWLHSQYRIPSFKSVSSSQDIVPIHPIMADGLQICHCFRNLEVDVVINHCKLFLCGSACGGYPDTLCVDCVLDLLF